MYADTVTDSIKHAVEETARRRAIQEEHNRKHNITPESIQKDIVDIIEREYLSDNSFISMVADYTSEYRTSSMDDQKALRDRLRRDMMDAAENLEFERAAVLRDQMQEVEKKIEIMEKVR